MRMSLDKASFFQTINHGSSRSATEARVLRQLGRRSRPPHGHHVETFHVRDIQAQNPSNRLVKADHADAVFSGTANYLRDQLSLAGFCSFWRLHIALV